MNLDLLGQMFVYSDWANGKILSAAERLSDAQLDQPFEIGRGSFRRTLIHTLAGEYVWFRRLSGAWETRWLDEDEPASIATVRARFEQTRRERDAFLPSLADADLPRVQTYRDSAGPVYHATLSEMLLQMLMHSTHHRAQLVNMLRQLGAGPVELDLMYWRRRPAENGVGLPR